MSELCTFFFWNLANRPLLEDLCNAIEEFAIDIVVLVESRFTKKEIETKVPGLNEPEGYSGKIGIYTTGNPAKIVSVFDDNARRLTIRKVYIGQAEEILLAAVHFVDKQNWTEEDQSFAATRLSKDIRDAEEKAGHKRTILVGDLNMNPFDKAVVAAAGIHGVMTKEIAKRQFRTVDAEKYPFFYNPMWEFLGDRTAGPPGTYFYQKAVHVIYFWNILDQVLLRPDLMDCLVDLRILDHIAGRSLLNTSGRPSVSDHLPLLFTMRFE